MLFPPPQSPSQPPRVVVTGAGVVTPLGVGWPANAAGFRAGAAAFGPVTLFDVSRQRTQRAAEVRLPETLPPNHLTIRQVSRLDRATRMLLLAAHEAWQQSGWTPGEALPFVVGTTSGGMSLGENFFKQALRVPVEHRRQATRAQLHQPQVQARVVADALGCEGAITVVSTACASGSDAIGQAWELLRRGRAERVLTGGYDALCQLVFAGFDSLQALTTTVCRPFDARRDGLALGEGAAVLALETLEYARRRDAEILGEIIGYGSAVDLHHLTQPHPQGDAALASMTRACAIAGIAPDEVGYINAHGTGTSLNDSAEALAIQRWAGPRVGTMSASSTKASIGHLLGAAGAVEAVVCLMALRGQWLPPEVSLETPDPIVTFPIVREPQDAHFDVALSNSFGFGGANATLLFRRWA